MSEFSLKMVRYPGYQELKPRTLKKSDHPQALVKADHFIRLIQCFRNQEQQNIKKEKTAKMRRELEDGLEKWGKQILEVQDNNIKRAENQAEHKKKSRRDRSREERRGRERRVMERRKQSKEREDENLKLKRIAIETKDKKVKILMLICCLIFLHLRLSLS